MSDSRIVGIGLAALALMACSAGAEGTGTDTADKSDTATTATSTNATTETDSLTVAKPGKPLDVYFANCNEYAGFVTIPEANAAPFVPAPYKVATSGGTANFIARLASCQTVSINGGPSHPGIVEQLGVNIVPPDGTGDINNYTGWYDTNSAELASALRASGINALYDPLLVYEVKGNPFGGEAHVTIGSALLPTFLIDSDVETPTASTQPIPYLANWWQNGAVMKSDYPVIWFGPFDSPGVVIKTLPHTALASLLGGTSATFSTNLSVFDHIEYGTMHVGPATVTN
jgi:hypothetical protein